MKTKPYFYGHEILEKVIIFPRIDCCSERLERATVTIYGEAGEFTYDLPVVITDKMIAEGITIPVASFTGPGNDKTSQCPYTLELPVGEESCPKMTFEDAHQHCVDNNGR